MILVIPDRDIKDVNFFKIRNELASNILPLKKLSFLIFYDHSLRVAFESTDENFSMFLNNFRNIYPVSYQVYGTSIKKTDELFFTRKSVFPLIPALDVPSFIANNIEINKEGTYRIEIERSGMPMTFIKKARALSVLNKSKVPQEREIAKSIMRKISMPMYRVRIFSSNPDMLRIAYDFNTGQGLSKKGKKIFMNAEELAYFMHYPLSLNLMRKPW
ncbi:MAG: hypothetical protein ACP5TO_03980 [Thermoplasmata archaeon]